jgi:hypothetical protein
MALVSRIFLFACGVYERTLSLFLPPVPPPVPPPIPPVPPPVPFVITGDESSQELRLAPFFPLAMRRTLCATLLSGAEIVRFPRVFAFPSQATLETLFSQTGPSLAEFAGLATGMASVEITLEEGGEAITEDARSLIRTLVKIRAFRLLSNSENNGMGAVHTEMVRMLVNRRAFSMVLTIHTTEEEFVRVISSSRAIDELRDLVNEVRHSLHPEEEEEEWQTDCEDESSSSEDDEPEPRRPLWANPENAESLAILVLRQKTVPKLALAGPREGHSPPGECVICLTQRSTCVAIPCGHVCACVQCARSLIPSDRAEINCPLCRETVYTYVPCIF